METENGSNTKDDESTPNYSSELLQVERLKELSRQPDIYEKLTRSLAPNIWELDDVKKGLLCQVPYFPTTDNYRINLLFIAISHLFYFSWCMGILIAFWRECIEVAIWR